METKWIRGAAATHSPCSAVPLCPPLLAENQEESECSIFVGLIYFTSTTQVCGRGTITAPIKPFTVGKEKAQYLNQIEMQFPGLVRAEHYSDKQTGLCKGSSPAGPRPPPGEGEQPCRDKCLFLAMVSSKAALQPQKRISRKERSGRMKQPSGSCHSVQCAFCHCALHAHVQVKNKPRSEAALLQQGCIGNGAGIHLVQLGISLALQE